MLISIIIATYNASEHIRACLESVSIQTYEDYEVIIVDGKSQDSTLEIIGEFKGKIKNLVVKSESDSGLYDAWNKGLKLSSGKWINFIGADDIYYSQESLRIFAEKIIDTSRPFYYGQIACNGPDGNISAYLGSSWFDLWSTRFHHYQIKLPFPIMTCVFNRKFIRNEKFDLNYRVVADADLVLRCLKTWVGEPPSFIENEKPLVRMGYGGISTNPRTHKLTLKEIYSIRNNNNISNINLQLFLRTCKVEILSFISKVFGDDLSMSLIKLNHKLRAFRGKNKA